MYILLNTLLILIINLFIKHYTYSTYSYSGDKHTIVYTITKVYTYINEINYNYSYIRILVGFEETNLWGKLNRF